MKKTEIGALIIIFASIFFFRLFWVTFKEKIEVGDYIEISGRVEAGKGKIEKINGKFPKENIYFIVPKTPDGEKNIYGKVTKIKYSKWGTQYKIEAEEIEDKIDFLKEIFIKKIKRITEEYSIGLEHFFRATILGEGYLLDNDLKDKFRYTGTAHILVISGLHIGVIISGMIFLFLKLNLEKKVRYVITLIILTVYVFSIGGTPSVFRAYIMATIYLLGNILYEKVDSKKSFIIAFCISLLIYPNWIYSISFWLSYVAVFSIIFIYHRLPKFKNKILNLILMSFIIQVSLTPIFYIFFKNIPLFSFFSNILIIPLASIFVILGFLTLFLSNFYLEFLVIPLVNYSYILLIKSVYFLSEIPYLTLEL